MALMDLFDREAQLMDGTDASQSIALFRDLDRPNEFVWLRGYPGPLSSGTLSAYYHGPVWAAQRDELERTLIRIESVHVLRPALMTPGLAVGPRPSSRPREGSSGVVSAILYRLNATQQDFPEYFNMYIE